uniref:Uncharacterized protein LOC111105237 isoform X1 n=1 Tax=Crassostrea virginica TaxID=6565 RepID=A0A8B8AVI1_CRAVI|nr:uncharacterized protein LOC111105237 isoform X1 [Crassostrea virginica]
MKLRSIRSCSFALLFDLLSTLNFCASELTTTQEYSGCPLGYHGQDCKSACRYPNFGWYCQDKCNCDKRLCNFKTGCQGTTKYNNLNPTSSSTHGLNVTYRKQSQVFFTTISSKLNLKEIADNENVILVFMDSTAKGLVNTQTMDIIVKSIVNALKRCAVLIQAAQEPE